MKAGKYYDQSFIVSFEWKQPLQDAVILSDIVTIKVKDRMKMEERFRRANDQIELKYPDAIIINTFLV